MKTVEIPTYSIIPIIETLRDYFNAKYPCTTDESCGDDMPIEDQVKWACYNALLAVYNHIPNYFNNEYDNILKSIN